MALAVVLHEVRGASAAQREFIDRAAARLGEALADPGFLAAVERADYLETRWTPLHGQWRALTAAEIAQRIADGLERGSESDRALDLAFELVDLPGPETGKPVLGST